MLYTVATLVRLIHLNLPDPSSTIYFRHILMVKFLWVRKSADLVIKMSLEQKRNNHETCAAQQKLQGIQTNIQK